jgi:hypothetical protein
MLDKERKGKDFNEEMIIWLAAFDLFSSVWFAMGTAPGHYSETFCFVQGFMIQLSALASILFNACLGYNLYSWVCEKKSLAKLRKRLPIYLGVSIFIPILLASLLGLIEGDLEAPIANSTFSSGPLWCWIGGLGDPKTLYWQMFAFYIFLIMAVASNFYFFARIRLEMMKNTSESHVKLVVTQLTRYLGVFVFLWFWGLLNRLLVGLNYAPFWTVAAHGTFVPLQGFCNMFLFGSNEISDLYEKIMFYATTTEGGQGNDADGKVLLETPQEPEYTDLKLFACTFNMGEGAVPSDMSQLLPSGHDLYIVGLQECMFLEEMRDAMERHLSQSEPYVRHEAEIGSTNKKLGFHGYIALTILVKKKYVEDGSFVVDDRAVSEVKRGANLVVTRAANKGGVGLPCRFFDQRLAFVTAHLASDSHGKTKLNKRLTDAAEMIGHEAGLCLFSDDLGFDFPDMNHHTFVLGDFNYRMSQQGKTPEEILEVIASCSTRQKEADAARTSASVPSSQNNAGKTTDSSSSPPLQRTPEMMSTDPWKDIYEHDELYNSIVDGTSFSLFEEPMIRFAPSYQRHDGVQGKLENDGDIGDLHRAFATVNKKDNKPRVPSYTDRILISSFTSLKHRITCEKYYIEENVLVSDHRPICGVYRMRVCTNAPTMQYYQGFHNRLLKKVGTFTPVSPRGADGARLSSPDLALSTAAMGGEDDKGARLSSPDLAFTGEDDVEVGCAENDDDEGDDLAIMNDQSTLEMGAFPKYKIRVTEVEVEWKKVTARTHMVGSAASMQLPAGGIDTMTTQERLATSEPEVTDLNSSSLETPPPVPNAKKTGKTNAKPSEDMVLSAAFPVPSEDVFSDERKVQELQASVGGSKLKISKRVEHILMPLSPGGLKLKAFAPGVSHLHVLLRIENSKHSGQAVVPLAEAAVAYAAKSGPKYATFERILTDKGQTTGILRGKIEVKLGREYRRTIRKTGGSYRLKMPTLDRSTWASLRFSSFVGLGAPNPELQLSPVSMSNEDSDVLQI